MLVALAVTAGCNASTLQPQPSVDPTMRLHQLHGLVAHSFTMGMEWANLRMLSAMEGETTQEGHAGDVPTGMQITHELGHTVGAVIDLLRDMR